MNKTVDIVLIISVAVVIIVALIAPIFYKDNNN